MKYKARKLSDIILPILDPVIRKKTGLTSAILKNWAHIVGPMLFEICLPLKLVWRGKNGPATLLLSASGQDSIMLMHFKPQIIEKVNSFFGYYAIDNIKCTQLYQQKLPAALVKIDKNISSLEEQKIAKAASNIKDVKLRSVILQFGRSIYINKKVEDEKKYY